MIFVEFNVDFIYQIIKSGQNENIEFLTITNNNRKLNNIKLNLFYYWSSRPDKASTRYLFRNILVT